jgi:hypothetical protein
LPQFTTEGREAVSEKLIVFFERVPNHNQVERTEAAEEEER